MTPRTSSLCWRGSVWRRHRLSMRRRRGGSSAVVHILGIRRIGLTVCRPGVAA